MLQHQEKTQSKPVELMKTGELLVKEGFIRINDIDAALSIQEKRQNSVSLNKSRLLGMILCDLNLITPMDNYYVLHKHNKLMSIQSAVVSKKMLSEAMVLKTIEVSQEQDIPFISSLLKSKLVSTTGMQSLLFDLFHIPFRSISDFIFNEKDQKELVHVLDQQKALENKIIPLVLKDNTILFGITDPQNILFIRKLGDQFPQYRFKALFIPFSGFSWFYKIIYKVENEPLPAWEKPLDLSLLLSFKTSVKDPEQESEAIRVLYERYELLRHLIGNPRRNDKLNEFGAFIIQNHRKITQEYGSRGIEFSLKKENAQVRVIAFPKIE